MQRYRLYIEGKYVDPIAAKWFDTYDPYTGEPRAQVAQGDREDVDRAVCAAYSALTNSAWTQFTASQRGRLLQKLGDLIARDAAKLAEIEVRDNGKLIAEMRSQLEYLPQWYYYFGARLTRFKAK